MKDENKNGEKQKILVNIYKSRVRKEARKYIDDYERKNGEKPAKEIRKRMMKKADKKVKGRLKITALGLLLGLRCYRRL